MALIGRRRTVIAIAGTAGIAACLIAGWALYLSPSARARAMLDEYLLDPGSAQLRDVRTSATYPGNICGLVNAKNRMGGYVGFRRFIASRNVVEIEPEADDRTPAAETFRGLWDTYCLR